MLSQLRGFCYLYTSYYLPMLKIRDNQKGCPSAKDRLVSSPMLAEH